MADIQEGKNAGLLSVGIVEGSSIMGLSEQEYQALTPQQKNEQSARVRKVYQQCGADFVLEDMRQLPALIDTLENT